MTISILIIISILLAAGFWIYFKKNSERISETKDMSKDERTKREFNDLNKMLSHVNQKEGSVTENELTDNDNILKNSKVSENKEDTEINPYNIKEKIIGSIILDKKKKK